MVQVIDSQNKTQVAAKAQDDKILAEAMPEGILVINAQQQVLWCNKKARALLHLPNQQLPISIIDIITETHWRALAARPIEHAYQCDAPHDPRRRLSMSLHPYRNDQNLLLIQDITRTFRLECMRQDFIANVSHELRTPLTVFRGYLELLQDSLALDPKQYQEILDHMNSQSARMERLVQDLLLLSRLESDQPTHESKRPIRIAEMLRDIVEDATSLSGEQHHDISLELDEELTLCGYPEELRSAFSNLIYNAVHYTPPNGSIQVSWYQDEQGKHMQVKDNGIGIAAKYIARITQRFYRVDKARSSGRRGGTGLGLAIVKHVLLRHGGELDIKSKLNVGSTFTCTFQR